MLLDINKLLQERLFSAIKKVAISEKKNKFVKSTDYIKATTDEKKQLLNDMYANWNKAIGSFYLTLHDIQSLQVLVEREKEIIEFDPEEVTIIRADYRVREVDFSVSYPVRFTNDMQKEIEDCLEDIKSLKYQHVVDNYKEVKDAERTPHEPLTNAKLKYSAFYLFRYSPTYTTKIATLLHEAGLITNINTSGWEIPYDDVEDIISLLNKKYEERQVLQYKRKQQDDKKIERDGLCIMPKHFDHKYFPKDLIDTDEFRRIKFKDGRESIDAQKLYEFIYYITLSTQMKNSIYDISEVNIVVGQKMLKQKANSVIPGQENWELLTGMMLDKLKDNDNSENHSPTIVIPDLYQEQILVPNNVYKYKYTSKRPRRYGVGRFITQILEKNGIGDNSIHDEIIDNLVKTKAVIEVRNMLIPQDIAIFAMDWIKEHAPLLIDFEYFKDLNEKIRMVEYGELTKASVIEEIDSLVSAAFTSSVYLEDTAPPSDAKLKLIKAIIAKNNIIPEEGIFQSNVKCDLLIAKYPTMAPIVVAKCPECNANILQKEYINPESGDSASYFTCEKFKKSQGCSFSIWDSYINKFFSKKGLELYTVDERREILIKILSRKKGYLISGLLSKAEVRYDARIYASKVEEEGKPTKWYFKLNFANDKEKNETKTNRLVVPQNTISNEPKNEISTLKSEVLKIANNKNQNIDHMLDNESLMLSYKNSNTINTKEEEPKQVDTDTTNVSISYEDNNDIFIVEEGDTEIDVQIDDFAPPVQLNDNTKDVEITAIVLMELDNIEELNKNEQEKVINAVLDILKKNEDINKIEQKENNRIEIYLINKRRIETIRTINSIRKLIEDDSLEKEILFTSSIGVAFCEKHLSLEDIEKKATFALLQAIKNGRNRIEIKH